MQKRRYALRLAYDGSAFRGFQRQPGLVTVQGSVEDALARLCGRVRIQAAARTDAGVHAVDQVVTFNTRAQLDPVALRTAVNAHTPPALVCLDAAPVPRSVHARASARSRTYVYLVGWPAPEELRGHAWSLPDPRAFREIDHPVVDLTRGRSALALIVGEHDFGGFARSGEQTRRRAVDTRATVATVTRATIIAASGLPLAAFVLEGESFVRAMIRNVVGTVVAVALGLAQPSIVTQMLLAPGERYRGVRAPGWGLTLARVAYPRPLFS